MMLQESFPDYIIDEAWDAKTVMALMKKNEYPLVLLDLVMPNTDPTILLHHIKNFHPETKVLVLSMNDEALYGVRSIRLGAKGYLKKRCAQRGACKGDQYYSGRQKICKSGVERNIIGKFSGG
jgi:two-component system invasion response regulator UvrY